MKAIATLLLLAPMVLATLPGCATYTALAMEGPTHDESVRIGMHRMDVERILGVPVASEYEDDGVRVVRYEYADGPPGGTKVRSLLYVAGDLFTFFLSELVFWPIELYANERIQRVAIAQYDDNELVDWRIERSNGRMLARASAPPEPRPEEPPASAPDPGATETLTTSAAN